MDTRAEDKKILVSKHVTFILQPSIVEYRIPFYDYLDRNLSYKFYVFAGDQTLLKGVSATNLNPVHWLKKTQNRKIYSLPLYWQRGLIHIFISSDLSVININPRNLTNWAILVVRKLLNRPSIGWGHLFSASGPKAKGNILRFAQYWLCDGIALYTDQEIEAAPLWMHKRKIVGLQNSSVSAQDCRTSTNQENLNDIIFVGRLEPEKKVLALVEAFASILSLLPKEARLVIVGGGTDEEAIKERYKNLIAEGRLVLMGWIWNNNELYDVYQRALIAASPGYIGLNAIQSFAFGTPMIISRNEPHSPEIAACVEGANAVFYDSEDDRALGITILDVFAQKAQWVAKRENIAAQIKSEWTVEQMATRFAKLLKEVEACAS